MLCWNRWIAWALLFRARSGGVEGGSWRRIQSKPWCFGMGLVCARGGEGKIELIIIIIIMSSTPVSSSNKDIGASLSCNQVICRNAAKWDIHGREECPL